MNLKKVYRALELKRSLWLKFFNDFNALSGPPQGLSY